MHFFTKTILSAISFAATCAVSAHADTWVDKDSETLVTVENGTLTIFSVGSFYFFDELFSVARKGTPLWLCIGADNGTHMPTDCLMKKVPKAGFNNEGKNRSLQFEIQEFPFVFELMERALKNGETVRVSIDNDDIFASYTLNSTYKLNDKALEILKLPD